MRKSAIITVLCALLVGCLRLLPPVIGSLSGRDAPAAPEVIASDTAERAQDNGQSADPAVTPGAPTTLDLVKIIDNMSLAEKVGQMFFVRCPETDAEEDITSYHFGGVLLFTRDYKDAGDNWLTREAFTEKLQRYQTAAQAPALLSGSDPGTAIPLFIGSDEEGGTVTRASRNPNLFSARQLSPQALYRASGMKGLLTDTLQYNDALCTLGVNVNLAPVCDVSTNENDFIYDRSFGQSAGATADYVSQVVGVMKKAGVACVLKHFPGYGSNADTHTGIAVDERPYETFAQSDFLPFAAGIAAGADFVLVSHNIVNCMDTALPASLSPAVHRELRGTLGFNGVAITDDLAMDAVKEYGDAAVLAVLAGNDMLITSDYKTDIPAVIAAVQDGRIRESDINSSVMRILNVKLALGLLGE